MDRNEGGLNRFFCGWWNKQENFVNLQNRGEREKYKTTS
jgi:hypothetical protein